MPITVVINEFDDDVNLITGGIFSTPIYLNVIDDYFAIRADILSLNAVGATNWQAAIQALNVISGVTYARPDLIIFMTDGDPGVNQGATLISAWENTTQTSGEGAVTTPVALATALTSAGNTAWGVESNYKPEACFFGILNSGTGAGGTNVQNLANAYSGGFTGLGMAILEPTWATVGNSLLQCVNTYSCASRFIS
jgi:hypothetical protein